jgi:hypothetical protein
VLQAQRAGRVTSTGSLGASSFPVSLCHALFSPLCLCRVHNGDHTGLTKLNIRETLATHLGFHGNMRIIHISQPNRRRTHSSSVLWGANYFNSQVSGSSPWVPFLISIPRSDHVSMLVTKR